MAKPEPIVAEVMNISQKGLFLRTSMTSASDALRLSTSLASDVPVTIALQFAGEGNVVRARGVVAWKSDLGIGINFENPPERLRDFVSDLHDAPSLGPVLAQVNSGWIDIG